MQDAKTQADIAQKQLNIQKQSFKNNIKIFDLQNVNAARDALAGIGLLTQGRQVQFKTNLAERNLARLHKLQDKNVKDAGTALGAVDGQIQLTWTELYKMEAAYGDTVQGLAETTMTWFTKAINSMTKDMDPNSWDTRSESQNNAPSTPAAKWRGAGWNYVSAGGGRDTDADPATPLASGFIGNISGATDMTVGEAGTETVAVLRNPRAGKGSFGMGRTPEERHAEFNIHDYTAQQIQEMEKAAAAARMMNMNSRQVGISGGGGGVTININHPVVRAETDIRKITDSVIRAINTKTALLGFR